MKIKGEEFTRIKDMITVGYSKVDAMCFDELGQAVMRIGIRVNEEKLKQWVKQAQYIESFSPENITDAATRDMVYNLQKENNVLEKALKLACEQIWAMTIWENTKEETIQDNIKFFKDKAKGE